MKNKLYPDALIFDIDGVLLDVRHSFPEVIRQCILQGWEIFCGGISDAGGYTQAHERLLKRHGAFNDDYDIAWTLLSISSRSGKRRLSAAFPSPEKLEEEIETFKGSVPLWVASRYGELVPRSEVRSLCAELYGTGDTGGLHMLETPMLHSHWSELPLPVGIYTGRNLIEWELAKKSLGWQDFPSEHVVHSDSGILKPSPEGLDILCKSLGSCSPLFFGDTASDMKAHKAFGKGDFVAIGELLPEAGLIFKDTESALEELLNFQKGRQV
ncbi:MAG: HAD family hydrolase [Synergistaceae bacterium]|nr:HAD family hydrolase [Synergistaceae bacterium]